jgi:hypothetical protein
VSALFRPIGGRPAIAAQALIVLWLAWLYDEVNDLAPLRRAEALTHAASLLHFEQVAGFSPELALDHWTASHAAVALLASYYYVAAHFFVTFGLLAYLWWRRTDLYLPLRNQLILINLIAFAIFWLFPLAPPRMLTVDGFRDVIAISGAVGDFHRGGLASTADQYAAMPSLHVAWAIWCCIVVWRLTRSVALRTLAAVYPVITALVVVATGNHFAADVLAGAIVAFGVLLAQRAWPQFAWQTRWRLLSERSPAGAPRRRVPAPVETAAAASTVERPERSQVLPEPCPESQ